MEQQQQQRCQFSVLPSPAHLTPCVLVPTLVNQLLILRIRLRPLSGQVSAVHRLGLAHSSSLTVSRTRRRCQSLCRAKRSGRATNVPTNSSLLDLHYLCLSRDTRILALQGCIKTSAQRLAIISNGFPDSAQWARGKTYASHTHNTHTYS